LGITNAIREKNVFILAFKTLRKNFFYIPSEATAPENIASPSQWDCVPWPLGPRTFYPSRNFAVPSCRRRVAPLSDQTGLQDAGSADTRGFGLVVFRRLSRAIAGASCRIMARSMKHLAFLITGILAALYTSASIQADTEQGQSLGVGGDAPPMCAITSTPTSSQAANVSLSSADLSQGRIVIDQLIDPSTAQLQPASIKLSFDVTCNGPHRVLIRSTRGALEPENPPSALAERFATEVYYTAFLTWDNTTIEMTASGNAGTAQSESLSSFAVTGKVDLEVKIDGALNDMLKPLLEGKYSDTLVIVLRPQI